jgi:hypothetical protein
VQNNKSPFAGVLKIFTGLGDAQNARNKVSQHFANLEKERNEAVAKWYETSAIEDLEAAATLRARCAAVGSLMSESFSSLALSQAARLTECPEAIEALETALKARSEELSQRIETICHDAREFADRSCIPHFEPPAVQVLREELQKVSDGIHACQNMTGNAAIIWRQFSPLVQVAVK